MPMIVLGMTWNGACQHTVIATNAAGARLPVSAR